MHHRPSLVQRVVNIETLGYFEAGDAFFGALALLAIVALGLVPLLLLS